MLASCCCNLAAARCCSVSLFLSFSTTAAGALATKAGLSSLPPIRSKLEIDSFLRHSPAGLMTIPGDDRSLKTRITKSILLNSDTVLTLPNIHQVASQLHLSPQTLHRNLKREGTSYQRIKESIRRDLAMTALVKDRLPVKQVAELVGFSESRSITRAFKQWTGLSPREYCRYV